MTVGNLDRLQSPKDISVMTSSHDEKCKYIAEYTSVECKECVNNKHCLGGCSPCFVHYYRRSWPSWGLSA